MRFRPLLVPAGLALCLFAPACGDGQPSPATPTPTPGQPTPTQVSNTRPPENSGGNPPLPTKVNPELLINKITQLQRANVRDSVGKQAGQCFTEVDLDKFKAEKKTAQIVGQLEKDKDFLAIVDSISEMKPEERTALLDRALGNYRKTWAELGLDPDSSPKEKLREGQTEKGQEAEKLIAEAVVDLVRKKLIK